jgi:hypothetical protein
MPNKRLPVFPLTLPTQLQTTYPLPTLFFFLTVETEKKCEKLFRLKKLRKGKDADGYKLI